MYFVWEWIKCDRNGMVVRRRGSGGLIYGRERVGREVRRSVRMEEKHNHIHATPLAFAFTVSWLLLIALPHSHSQPPLSPPLPPPWPPPPPCAQQSYLCSTSVSAILDPFWGQNPASQCNGGDAPSQLICNTRDESQNLTVKDIDYTSHTLKVMLKPPVNDVCSPYFFQSYENFSSTLLLYKVPVHEIIIFHNCPRIPEFPSKRKFTCGDFLYYFEEEEMLHRYPQLKDCKGNFSVAAAAPLDGYDDSDDGAAVLEQALSDAFEVNYGVPDGCCRESDESCWRYGYDEDVVPCNYYCANQNCSTKGNLT
ncbi:hypothetical protein DEO72_LG5g271 [Vigna unguiculata]|uniref:Wall-associated receptor kinase n=1 Tax=Vigna unguiculata TaxID=3917 RepID=A0A4D6LUU6_VIGUN|nr:hypothetical protein DEO72_LG5g271 [Vigna unguiculata]